MASLDRRETSVFELPAYHLPPPPGWVPGEFASYGVASEPVPEMLLPPTRPLRAHKDGFFQKLSGSLSYIPPSSSGLGLTESQIYATVAVPAPTREWPMLISPSFQFHWLDGPAGADLPDAVYDTWLEFMWVPRISPRWQGILTVAPGVYSDFDGYSSDAFRITGRGLARFQWEPDRLEFIFGVLYLNRADIQLLPAGGIIWVPRDDLRLELLFPRPKLSWRFRLGSDFEDWVFLGGEFGGDTWLVRRGTGSEDRLTLRDWRILFGVERKRDGGAGVRLEAGYVFNRTLEFSSGPEYSFDDSLLVRCVLMF